MAITERYRRSVSQTWTINKGISSFLHHPKVRIFILANAFSIPYLNAYDRRFEFCLIAESRAVLLEFRPTLLSKFFLGSLSIFPSSWTGNNICTHPDMCGERVINVTFLSRHGDLSIRRKTLQKRLPRFCYIFFFSALELLTMQLNCG